MCFLNEPGKLFFIFLEKVAAIVAKQKLPLKYFVVFSQKIKEFDWQQNITSKSEDRDREYIERVEKQRMIYNVV